MRMPWTTALTAGMIPIKGRSPRMPWISTEMDARMIPVRSSGFILARGLMVNPERFSGRRVDAADLLLLDAFHIIVQLRESVDVRDDEAEHQHEQNEHDDGRDAIPAFANSGGCESDSHFVWALVGTARNVNSGCRRVRLL